MGVGSIVHFHGNMNASVDKELLRQHAFPHLHKLKIEYLCKTMYLTTKLKLR